MEIDCFEDADTQSGFWSDVYGSLSQDMGNDDQSGEFILWFVADYHNLVAISDETVTAGDWFHTNDQIYLEWNEGTSTCDITSTATLFKAWVIDDWKRCYIVNLDLATSDYYLAFEECEESWREGGAYIAGVSKVCKTASLDAATETYAAWWQCDDSLVCMTEDPNASAPSVWTEVPVTPSQIYTAFK